jgi:hypothetical protein
MPKKKFGPDDVFHNTVKTYPKYNFTYYFNNSYINNRQTDGQNVVSGTLSLYELNVDREVGTTDLISNFIIKGENDLNFVPSNVADPLTNQEYKVLNPGTIMRGTYPITSSISRERLIGNGAAAPFSGFDILEGISEAESVRKIIALQNVYQYNEIYSNKFNYSDFYISGAINAKATTIQEAASPYQKYMSLFCFPEIFKAQRVRPGSVELNFYITGTLIGTAKDTKRNGEIVETYGPRTGSTVGTISYKEGIMILTGNYVLDSSVQDGYLSPSFHLNHSDPLSASYKDSPRWAHFGAYQSFITNSLDPVSGSYAPVSSSYELKFEGTNAIPTLTMFCHANKNEMNWSNNLSYLDREYATGSTYQEIVVAQTGSNYYKEKETLTVKNTISSSFDNYSASYSDQTFISKINIFDNDGNIIAVAKLAKPVTKTNSTDYTFKLKIDL